MKILKQVLFVVLSWATFTVAEAHAFLDHAEPRVGSIVHSAPDQVKIWLTENVQPALSSIKVLSADGKRVDKEDAKIVGATMTVSVYKLSAGTYKVKWMAVSVDGHKTESMYLFTVQ